MRFYDRVPIALCGLLVWAASPLLAQDAKPKDLDARLRTLEKEITAARGLAFKTPVQAKIIARPAKGAVGVQGYYNPKEKTLFLYDDVKDSYQQGVLIHEMVHALQDQHFDLVKLRSKLHIDKYDSDSELALAALIEGDATFTMIEVLKKTQPKVAGMLESPLEKSKNPQNAFLYAQGARYVKAIKERGGWTNVNFAYKFPPRTTATIFNLGGITGMDLGAGHSRGAFALYKDLVDHPSTRELSLQAALGWRGDRVVEHPSGKAWVVACNTTASAAVVQTALTKLKEEQPGLKPHKLDDASAAWTAADGAVHGVLTRGKRVYRLEAASAGDFRKLLDYLDGPLQVSVIATKDKKQITFGEMIERLLDADIVCVGETHDSETHHRVQLQVIKGLHAFDERLGVGMEMFQRPFQKELDRHVNGEGTEEEFLKASEYKQRWGFEWSLYQPIVDFCRKNRVPLAALNAPKELTSRISKAGVAGLNDEEKKQVANVDFQLKEHREYWFERLSKMHGPDFKTTPEQKERSYQVMSLWDGYMADSAAQFQRERRIRRMVILAGSGHIDRGFGIPLRTARHTGGKVLTVKIEVGKAASDEVVSDFVVIVR